MAVKIDRRIPELMSVTEVAEMYGISRAGVKYMITEGRLPARKVGSTYVIRRAVAEGMPANGLRDTPPGQ